MRELVYVSAAKLRQLLPDLPKAASGLRDVNAELTTPVVGFKIGKAARKREPGLAEAVKVLEASSRAPRWFADPEVQPGYWVHFEARLSYGALRSSVVFLDPDNGSADLSTGGRLRLLLHGSAQHIVGAEPPEVRQIGSPSMWAGLMTELRALDQRLDSDAHSPADLGDRWDSHISDYVYRLTLGLQPHYTAAWMGGYARVTAMIPTPKFTILAATPLYVELVDPPEA